MAIWRDPLDELIADLESTLPKATEKIVEIPPFGDHCFWVQSILSEDPAERQRLANDPRVQRVQAYYDAWAASVAQRGNVADPEATQRHAHRHGKSDR
jgi:hypothetical protein